MDKAMSLDNHGQPINQSFNFLRNKDKAVYGLKGLLDGITADRKLNELEFLFLDVWLKEQSAIKNDGDVIDLLDLIGDILEDGVITTGEMKELYSLCKDIIKYRDTEFTDNEDKINEFNGLLSGIVADNVLNDLEISKLLRWFKKNKDVKGEWPINVIFEKLNLILEDKIVTADEREHLLEVIKEITGVRFKEYGVAYGMATEFFEDNIKTVNYDNCIFCFTGTFVTGTRAVVQNMAKNKGAIVKNNVNKNLDYLIVGTLASRDWRFTSHGKKIEKALQLKKSGEEIIIINERTWLKDINNNVVK